MIAARSIRLLLPASLALLTACAEQSSGHIVAIDSQHDCPKTLNVGQTLLLTLPSNPTTGFRWSVLDAAAPTLESLTPEVYSPGSDGMVGGAGESAWRYLAKTVGSAHLKMVYQQPWAPGVTPAKSFDCAIEVR